MPQAFGWDSIETAKAVSLFNSLKMSQFSLPRKWRVSTHIQIPNGQYKEIHKTFHTYKKARREYKAQLSALYKQDRYLHKWKVCLNRIEEPNWINPRFQDRKGFWLKQKGAGLGQPPNFNGL